MDGETGISLQWLVHASILAGLPQMPPVRRRHVISNKRSVGRLQDVDDMVVHALTYRSCVGWVFMEFAVPAVCGRLATFAGFPDSRLEAAADRILRIAGGGYSSVLTRC